VGSAEKTMLLYYSGFVLAAAFVAAVLGFGILSGPGSWIPRVLFVVFMILFAISFARRRPRVPRRSKDDDI